MAAGGFCGAAGVALSALAAHAGGGNIGIVASFVLAHAPALLAIGFFAGQSRGPRTGFTISGALLLLGLLLFSTDLLMREYAGHRLFAMAAPAGGVLLIGGWLAIAASALLPGRES